MSSAAGAALRRAVTRTTAKAPNKGNFSSCNPPPVDDRHFATPFDVLPFRIDNIPRLWFTSTMFMATGLGLPFLLLHYALTKK